MLVFSQGEKVVGKILFIDGHVIEIVVEPGRDCVPAYVSVETSF